MLSTNRWQQRQMGDRRQPQGKRAFYLSFTATMEHVRYILLLLFSLTVCINILENYLTSCLRAIDWVVGPQSILTDVSLAILRGAPLTLASGRCIIQTGRGKWCLYFHQSCQDFFFCLAKQPIRYSCMWLVVTCSVSKVCVCVCVKKQLD